MFKKKVIVRFKGGLGNQMFQYATGRALALRINAELILDYDDVELDRYGRLFELDRFNIQNNTNRFYSYKYPFGRYVRAIARRLHMNNIPDPRIKNVYEHSFLFNPMLLLDDCPSVYLYGYWQSERYFKDYADVIRTDFTFNISFEQNILNELSFIQSYGDRAVALCVRRYQEVTNRSYWDGKIMDKVSYLQAIEEIKKRVDNPVFFCFSQVPEWVKSELAPTGIEIKYISPKTGVNASLEDLYLLSHFKNFIISNSTYYWWGAWLSTVPNKLVISPTNWYPSNIPSESIEMDISADICYLQ